MKKQKYLFNPETLSYIQVEFSKRQLLKKLSSRFAVSFILGIIFFVLSWYNFDSPSVRFLEAETSRLLLKFEIIHRRTEVAIKALDIISKRDNDIYRAFFEMPTIPSSVRKAGFGGSDRYKKFREFQNTEVLTESAKKIDILSKQVYVQSVSFDKLESMIQTKERMLSCIPSIPPIMKKHITAFGPFGMRFHPILHITRMHNGVDLCSDANRPIHATGDGEVITTSYIDGLGNYVVIKHGFGYETWYGHCNKFLVKSGQKVKRGDVIALVGTTGLSYSNHVHYEVHKFGVPIDPANFFFDDLNDEEYQKIKDMAENSKVGY